MQEADGLVVASPVYVDDVSGLVKTWIDRLAFVCHRPEFPGKCAALIATVGDSPTGHTLRTMQTALLTWGFHIVSKAGFKAGARMKTAEMQSTYDTKTRRIARSLFQAIQKQQYAAPGFFSLMMFRIQQLAWSKAAHDSLDFHYLSGQGWTDMAREFYIPHRTGRVKTLLARLTGQVIARFVS
jgi:hypothetical protein